MSYIKQSKIEKEEICALCQDSLKDKTKAVFRTTCCHLFHNKCLLGLCNYLHREIDLNIELKCPICRATLDINDCSIFDAFESKDFADVSHLPKEVRCIYRQKGGKYRTKKRNNSKKRMRKRNNTRKNN